MKRNHCTLLLTVVAILMPVLNAQKSFWDDADAYLGQTRPSNTPKVFAPGLLTDGSMFVMGRVAFSADGKEFYYSESDSWQRGDHISMKMIRYANHQWGKPVVLNQHFLSPTLSLDGRALFMRRVAPGSSMKNVWQSLRIGDSWSVPQAFLERPYGLYDYMPTASGNAYVGSDPSPEDTKNGITYAYSVLAKSSAGMNVKSLGLPLNEPGFNGDLYVAPDESYMIVSAKETKTFESQLYISFRKPDSTWTVPVSLGTQINNGSGASVGTVCYAGRQVPFLYAWNE